MVRTLKSFEYFAPAEIDEALRILSSYGRKAKIVAGGVDLIVRMRRREVDPKCVINIQMISALDYLKADKAGRLRIGALTKLRSVEVSPLIQRDYILLQEAVHQIASIQIKNMGTVVGNLCVGTAASDVAPVLVALGAELRIKGLTSERRVAVEDFYVGPNQTVLKADEIVTEIVIPSISIGTGTSFLNLNRTATDISKINVAVRVKANNKRCEEVSIALGAVAPTVIRARKAEEILKENRYDKRTIDTAAKVAAEHVKPITDIRSTAEYRKEMTEVLVRRAIGKALDRAQANEMEVAQ